MANTSGGLFSISVTGGEAVKHGLVALLASMQNMQPFWRDVFAPKYFAIVQDGFATGGAQRGSGGRFAGGNWAWLSPKYAAWKHKHYPGQPLLVREGTLRESVRWGGTGVGSGGIFEAYSTFAIVGTTVPYGNYHQYGTSRMPARPFLPPPDPAVFAPLMHDWIVKSYETGKAGAPSESEAGS
jgi:phage gpG-like protein